MSGLVRYPFPLRPGLLVYLDLPSDLTGADVRKLARYMETLIVPRGEGSIHAFECASNPVNMIKNGVDDAACNCGVDS